MRDWEYRVLKPVCSSSLYSLYLTMSFLLGFWMPNRSCNNFRIELFSFSLALLAEFNFARSSALFFNSRASSMRISSGLPYVDIKAFVMLINWLRIFSTTGWRRELRGSKSIWLTKTLLRMSCFVSDRFEWLYPAALQASLYCNPFRKCGSMRIMAFALRLP